MTVWNINRRSTTLSPVSDKPQLCFKYPPPPLGVHGGSPEVWLGELGPVADALRRSPPSLTRPAVECHAGCYVETDPVEIDIRSSCSRSLPSPLQIRRDRMEAWPAIAPGCLFVTSVG